MESIMEKPAVGDGAGGGGGRGGGGGGINKHHERAKSEQLAPLQSLSRTASAETVLSNVETTTSQSRKSSFGRKQRAGGGGGGNSHIRKSRSAQLKLDVEDLVSNSAALSRASSASLGFSFTFTGFTPPPQYTRSAEPVTFSDDDTRTHARFHLATSIAMCIYIRPKAEAKLATA
jgi:hypothetical protein